MNMDLPGVSAVKNPLAWRSRYNQEDPLEKEMATHSSLLAGYSL